MNAIESFRRTKDGFLQNLEEGSNGYLCSEGETIVFSVQTLEIPRLLVRGESIPPTLLSREGEIFFAEFERLIDVWAGRTTFILEDGDTLHRLTLDIRPSERKLGIGAWDHLMEELSSISKSLPWGLSPGEEAGRLTPDALAVVHPAIVEQQLPVFLKLLGQLLNDPPVLTLRARTIRPLSMSKGADRQTIRWLSRRPLELAGLKGFAPSEYPPNPRAMADQPKLVQSFDHPVTRYIVFLLYRVHTRLSSTAASLKSAPQHGIPDPSVLAYARQLAKSVDQAKLAIETVSRSPIFRAVKPEPPGDAVLQSLPDHPLYSAIHRVGQRLANPGLAYAPGQDTYSAIKNTYDLFELMVLYRLVGALSSGLSNRWLPTKQARVKRLPLEDRPPDGAIWAWAGPDDLQLELIYQPRFQSAQQPPDRHLFSSLSAQAVPDYVLVIWKGQEITSWLILDAKYRSGRQSVHDGLCDIHRYRDGLRLGSMPAAAAYIVVPNLQNDATLYATKDYIIAHNFGALVVYDEGWSAPIITWLNGATGDITGSKRGGHLLNETSAAVTLSASSHASDAAATG